MYCTLEEFNIRLIFNVAFCVILSLAMWPEGEGQCIKHSSVTQAAGCWNLDMAKDFSNSEKIISVPILSGTPASCTLFRPKAWSNPEIGDLLRER